MPEDVSTSFIQHEESNVWFQNHGLFSDHFLKERLREWKEWQIGKELADFRTNLILLYDSQKSTLPNMKEAQTENEFIQPVFELLGYTNSYIVQTASKAAGQVNFPDYALYPDNITQNKAHLKPGVIDYTHCIGIAEAKYWERPLDSSQPNARDTIPNQKALQIVTYLYQTQQNWGILTNGRYWRLYSLKSHSHLANYYQVDIVQLLTEAPPGALKYFYLFFRKQALLSGIDGKTFLDHILEGSNDYAVELEINIKERAYQVVESLCHGFAADFLSDELTSDNLKAIYDSSLILLYRLLFVFYAEARELLPLVTNISYRENYSMYKVAKEIDAITNKGNSLSNKSIIYYQKINSLFGLINTGDKSLDIPEYNGGLFSSQEHPFLDAHSIADSYIAPAIQNLARIYDKERKQMFSVDYKTLSERHLGNIYEGLLEFKPRIAEYDLVVIKENSDEKYAPASEYPGKKVECVKGELYLANDKGERKATGSYYTPEYIVNYIVENTIDTLTKEAAGKVKALKLVVEDKIAGFQKLNKMKKGLEPTEKYDVQISKEYDRLLEPYLTLKVLDPAMGSGHFLARATDFLAEAIATDPYIIPPENINEESELIYYRRRVVESCIYGVDLNPLAVELAKLTLWLSTMAKSKPLSFLNPHLRVGNSLIGARVADLDEIPKWKGKKKYDSSRAPVQLGLFHNIFNQKLCNLLQNRELIAQLPTETLEDVHNKQKLEKDFEHNMERFHTLADVWVSTRLGNRVAWDEYNTLLENTQAVQTDWGKLLEPKSIQNALILAKTKRFFHWELEFPEVFFDIDGNPKEYSGFDAVIGNPPYIDSEEMTKSHPELREYCTNYWESASGNWDLFVVFVELGLIYTRHNGYSSFIVPNKLLGAEYSIEIQRIIKSYRPMAFRDYSRVKVFESNVYPIVYSVKSVQAKENDKISISTAVETETGQVKITQKSNIKFKVLASLPDGYWWSIFAKDFDIAAKTIENATALGNCAIVSGAASVSEYYVLAKSIIPFNSAQQKGKYFLFVNTGTIDRYECLWDTSSTQIGESYLRPIINKKELLDKLPKRYHQANAHKLVLAGMAKKLEGLYDAEGEILAGKSTVIILENSLSILYILGAINSKLLSFTYKVIFGSLALAGGFLVVGPPQIEKMPIRPINFTTPNAERKQLLKQSTELYKKYMESQDWSDILAVLEQWLPTKADGSPDTEHEHSDMVHDLLAFLAEEMTRLNKEKQSKIKAFSSWLEKEILKGSVEDQKNKTKIKDFYNTTFEDLLDVLKKNKIVSDPYPLDKRNILENEFNAALTVINPLRDKIKLTDGLIDQTVYKLYGLTKEEISIVDGIG